MRMLDVDQDLITDVYCKLSHIIVAKELFEHNYITREQVDELSYEDLSVIIIPYVFQTIGFKVEGSSITYEGKVTQVMELRRVLKSIRLESRDYDEKLNFEVTKHKIHIAFEFVEHFIVFLYELLEDLKRISRIISRHI